MRMKVYTIVWLIVRLDVTDLQMVPSLGLRACAASATVCGFTKQQVCAAITGPILYSTERAWWGSQTYVLARRSIASKPTMRVLIARSCATAYLLLCVGRSA
jgi:hypothetical protein